ncbi:hypothetical protein LWI28_018908 [Acer negundo]|uniref:Uncharacterized protein n=1 Tax=Acer negundo TaxID=4023 RepID=A0AAD5IZW6_ACENE|nr:hypothetical protein LWI28_018908 [Acer negundo]KAK4848181.1 hypothetical protein QYF36_010092 [Acer negundo]
MESAANKQRKLCNHDDDHHEEEDNVNDEEEEQKMEEFFALVRSIREARDRLMNNNGSSYHENKHQQIMKRKLFEEKDKPVIREAWNPTFQREDFLPDHHHHHQLKNPNVSILPTSSRDKQGTDQKADQGIKENLDLTLSL